jgi:hypothetical protein
MSRIEQLKFMLSKLSREDRLGLIEFLDSLPRTPTSIDPEEWERVQGSRIEELFAETIAVQS